MTIARTVRPIQARERVLLVATPHRRQDHSRHVTSGKDRRTEMGTAIGAVGQDITRNIRQRGVAGAAIVDVGWYHLDLLDQAPCSHPHRQAP
ncbi:hypothetical protein [Methylovirgula sp. HY1]|uniref:hypothetical protein n=1 Tax=Methylovirgula sp. HY1 TaxID=2822761 RepID=UPI001C5B0687|nr:hypothetical protein [Methylovirgula sp. HY1]QXX76566.1 hypothetical protein MHY1_p00088 [Methylovirgula sp. HY1]